MIKQFHILYNGFTQRHDNIGAGLAGLYARMVFTFNDTETIIWDKHWHEDVKETAAFIHRLGYDRETGQGPKLSVVGYSFGFQAAVDLCDELNNLANVPVQSLVACDGVRRRSTYPWGWLSAMNPYAKFSIPGNVEKLISYRQNENWPRGHEIVTDSPTTWHEDFAGLTMTHQQMDNGSVFLKTAFDEAERVRGR